MTTVLELGDITLNVVKKDIKNVHLSVYPPNGRVRVSAPMRMNLDTIRLFALAKLGWIKQQQKKLREQDRETIREYLDRESHYVWGKRYLLKIVEAEGTANVDIRHDKIYLQARSGTPVTIKGELLQAWYRHQIKSAVPALIELWSRRMNVSVNGFYVQQMKTKWGSCNQKAGTIRLNTDLAKKPKQCLEYIVVHELVHLLERNHNDNFRAYMDRFMPQWRTFREDLNRAPLSHVSWDY